MYDFLRSLNLVSGRPDAKGSLWMIGAFRAAVQDRHRSRRANDRCRQFGLRGERAAGYF